MLLELTSLLCFGLFIIVIFCIRIMGKITERLELLYQVVVKQDRWIEQQSNKYQAFDRMEKADQYLNDLYKKLKEEK